MEYADDRPADEEPLVARQPSAPLVRQSPKAGRNDPCPCGSGLLGSIDSFNERFALPIEKYQDESCRDQLRRLVHPFILNLSPPDFV